MNKLQVVFADLWSSLNVCKGEIFSSLWEQSVVAELVAYRFSPYIYFLDYAVLPVLKTFPRWRANRQS